MHQSGRAAPATPTSEILSLIRSGQAPTRNAIRAATGLSRSTVLLRVGQLIASGLVREDAAPAETPTAGRPPSRLSFNEKIGVVLAADLGASHGRVAVADLAGRALAERTGRIDFKAGPAEVTGWLEPQFRALLEEAARTPEQVLAVGVGLPGRVDVSEARTIAIVPGWSGDPLDQTLARAFAAPVFLDNDVKVMALGEHRAGGATLDPLLFVKLATGIGAGLVVDGSVYRGLHGAAGQLGHMRAPVPSDVPCTCGNRGCLAALVSGPAIARELRAAGIEAHGSEDVVRLVAAGNYAAFEHVRQAGRILGEALAMFVSMLAPQAIVLGGALAGAAEPLLAGVREVVYQRSHPITTGDLQILPSRLGARAGVVGAISLALDQVLSPEGLARLVAERAGGEAA
jgi:predicted NBD/HSP70 family sugar kinase